MKGIIFNSLEEVITRHFGEDRWDELLDEAGLDGAYTSLGTYPDEQLTGLVKAISKTIGKPIDESLRWFGRNLMPVLSERFPEFFTAYASTRPFVLALNVAIHAEVRQLYIGANCPTFDFSDVTANSVLIGYGSPRKLCAFAHGCIEGAADYYHESVDVEHLKCVFRGDERCLMRATFAPLEGALHAAA